MKARPQYVVVDRDNGHAVMARLGSEEAAKRVVTRLVGGRHGCENPFLVRPLRDEDGPDTGRNVVHHAGLSFVTFTYDNRGNYKSSNYFDVPLEGCCEGSITGSRVAGEYLQYVQLLANEQRPNSFGANILAEAGAAMLESGKGRTRYWAALAFVRLMAGMVLYAAQHSDHQSWVSGDIARHERDRQWADGYEAKQKAELIKRLAAGRARKAAERKAAAKPVAERRRAPVRRHEEVAA